MWWVWKRTWFKEQVEEAQFGLNYTYADGTRAHIGEERASFSQLQTPWTSLSHLLNWIKPRWMVFFSRGWLFLSGVFIFSRGVSFPLTLTTQDTIVKYRKGELNHLSEDEIWSAKHLYDSAYHPDTGGSSAKNNSVRLKQMESYFWAKGWVRHVSFLCQH